MAKQRVPGKPSWERRGRTERALSSASFMARCLYHAVWNEFASMSKRGNGGVLLDATDNPMTIETLAKSLGAHRPTDVRRASDELIALGLLVPVVVDGRNALQVLDFLPAQERVRKSRREQAEKARRAQLAANARRSECAAQRGQQVTNEAGGIAAEFHGKNGGQANTECVHQSGAKHNADVDNLWITPTDPVDNSASASPQLNAANGAARRSPQSCGEVVEENQGLSDGGGGKSSPARDRSDRSDRQIYERPPARGPAPPPPSPGPAGGLFGSDRIGSMPVSAAQVLNDLQGELPSGAVGLGGDRFGSDRIDDAVAQDSGGGGAGPRAGGQGLPTALQQRNYLNRIRELTREHHLGTWRRVVEVCARDTQAWGFLTAACKTLSKAIEDGAPLRSPGGFLQSELRKRQEESGINLGVVMSAKRKGKA